MKKYMTLFILFFSITIFSQEKLIDSELSYNDQLSGEVLFGIGKENISGLKQGNWVFQNNNGDLKVVGNFIDDYREGEWIYSKNDIIIMKINYKNDLLNGDFLLYNEFGLISTVGYYSNGLKDGLWVNYIFTDSVKYRDGKEVENDKNFEILYNQGQIVKESVFYRNDSNSLEFEITYNLEYGKKQSDQLSGLKLYYSNGQLLTEGKIDNLRRRKGKWNIYYPSGKLYTSVNFNNFNNEPIQSFFDIESLFEEISFRSIGSLFYIEDDWDERVFELLGLFEDFIYENKKLSGTQLIYYPNGNIKDSLTYDFGVLSGIQKGFWSTGKIQSVSNYNSSGNPIGEWSKYGLTSGISELKIYKESGYYNNYDKNTELVYEEKYLNNFNPPVLVYRSQTTNYKGKNIIEEFNTKGLLIRSYNYTNGFSIEKKFIYEDDINLIRVDNILTRYGRFNEIIKKEYFDENKELIKIERLGDWDGFTENDFQRFEILLNTENSETSDTISSSKTLDDQIGVENDKKVKGEDINVNENIFNNTTITIEDILPIINKLSNSDNEGYYKKRLKQLNQKNRFSIIKYQSGIEKLKDEEYFTKVYSFTSRSNLNEFFEYHKSLSPLYEGYNYIIDSEKFRLFEIKLYQPR